MINLYHFQEISEEGNPLDLIDYKKKENLNSIFNATDDKSNHDNDKEEKYSVPSIKDYGSMNFVS